MSAQAGTWYFDGRPVPRQIVEWAGHQLDPLGPDSSGSYVEPGVFLVHRALHVTPEDRAEQQPHRARDFVITWDGRLDNRADLLLQLGAAACTSDVDLVARCYDKWRLDALPRLIGDWSCAIWDRTSRQVHLASDYMGNRPLYWQRTRDALRWSSTLAAFPRDELTLDDEFMLGFLMVGAPPDSTPYRGVSSLSPGHVPDMRKQRGLADAVLSVPMRASGLPRRPRLRRALQRAARRCGRLAHAGERPGLGGVERRLRLILHRLHRRLAARPAPRRHAGAPRGLAYRRWVEGIE